MKAVSATLADRGRREKSWKISHFNEAESPPNLGMTECAVYTTEAKGKS
jgi:hypothetical protein